MIDGELDLAHREVRNNRRLGYSDPWVSKYRDHVGALCDELDRLVTERAFFEAEFKILRDARNKARCEASDLAKIAAAAETLPNNAGAALAMAAHIVRSASPFIGEKDAEMIAKEVEELAKEKPDGQQT